MRSVAPSSIVERPSRTPQFYGYAVCLIAVITLLLSVGGAVEAGFTLADPLRARERQFGFEASYTSFEAFRATYPRGVNTVTMGPDGPTTSAQRDTVSDAQLRERYVALRADHVTRAGFEARQRLAKHGLLMLLAIGLFVTHLKFARR
ncbi:MAG: hypothetical protein ACRETY_15295 [Steroidobacteraceae bacterium]